MALGRRGKAEKACATGSRKRPDTSVGLATSATTGSLRSCGGYEGLGRNPPCTPRPGTAALGRRPSLPHLPRRVGKHISGDVVGALVLAEHALDVVAGDAKPPAGGQPGGPACWQLRSHATKSGRGMGQRKDAAPNPGMAPPQRASGPAGTAGRASWHAGGRAGGRPSASCLWLSMTIRLVGHRRLFQCTNRGACRGLGTMRVETLKQATSLQATAGSLRDAQTLVAHARCYMHQTPAPESRQVFPHHRMNAPSHRHP